MEMSKTTKEKAKELHRSFYVLLGESDSWDIAKQCALIAVELVLDNDCKYWARDGVLDNELMIDREYWQEVKTEINKL